MYGEAKKLYLIEEILKLENEDVLAEVETVISKNKLRMIEQKGFKDFAGIWTTDEADDMKKIISVSCEQINPDDWK